MTRFIPQIDRSELTERVRKSIEDFKALPAEEQQTLHRLQSESFARSCVGKEGGWRRVAQDIGITEAQLYAAMDAFYPGENWRVDLGCALDNSLRDMRAALRAAALSPSPAAGGGACTAAEVTKTEPEATRNADR